MNYLMIAGHMGADPEVRFTSSGKKVTTLRLATNARRGNADETIWWRVTIWGEQFDKMMPYLKKGSALIVFGDLQKPEIFNDREGKPQVSMNLTANHIQFSPFGKPDRPQGAGGEGHDAAAPAMAPAASYGMPRGETANPYMPPSSAPRAPAGMQAPGGNFDDEVPF